MAARVRLLGGRPGALLLPVLAAVVLLAAQFTGGAAAAASVSSPTAAPITVSTPAGTPVTVGAASASIPGGSGIPVVLSGFSQGAHGTVRAGSGGTLTYTPQAGFSGVDTFTYTVRNPQSCSDIQAAEPGAGNGDYTLYPNSSSFTVYCDGMTSATPQAYLPLAQTGSGDNTSYTPGDGDGPPLTTAYTMVALNPQTLVVNVADPTFSTSSGGGSGFTMAGGPITSVPYAVAESCSGFTLGTANVDLVGTPFSIVNNFVLAGEVGGVTLTSNNQVASVTGVGNCGGEAPLGDIGYGPGYPNILSLTYIGPPVNGSASSTATVTVDVTSPPAVTTQPVSTTVGAGSTATLTAAVSGFPTPTVQWQVSTDGGTSFSSVPGANSSALSFTATGSDSGNEYEAVFSSPGGTATTSPATLTVNKAATTTSVSSSANPSVVDQGVTYTASVRSSAAGLGAPSGTVTFSDGATAICSAVALANGEATCTPGPYAVTGAHAITASYSGDTNFAGGTGTLSQEVNQEATTTSVATSVNPSALGQSVRFTVTVAVVAPGSDTPDGTVSLATGSTSLGTEPLSGSGGSATATLPCPTWRSAAARPSRPRTPATPRSRAAAAALPRGSAPPPPPSRRACRRRSPSTASP